MKKETLVSKSQVLTLTDECHADIADIIVNIALVVCYRTFFLPSDNICCLGLTHQGLSAVVVKLASYFRFSVACTRLFFTIGDFLEITKDSRRTGDYNHACRLMKALETVIYLLQQFQNRNQ